MLPQIHGPGARDTAETKRMPRRDLGSGRWRSATDPDRTHAGRQATGMRPEDAPWRVPDGGRWGRCGPRVAEGGRGWPRVAEGGRGWITATEGWPKPPRREPAERRPPPGRGLTTGDRTPAT